ncbi:uncharacterized protein TrAtP1_008449 [Trichoderma atroviride]|nr:hypothetical protein TrAtP1_008449 [Trichoderma atroviride]
MTQELKPDFDPETKQGRKLSYTSTKIRTNILKRFTTKNTQSNQRMLTSLRSPTGTEFLLRLEDTVLFDADNLGLFEKTTTPANTNGWDNKIDVWKSMIDFQMDQLGSEDIDWIHPLQFAQAMMMSAKDWDIGSTPKDQMTKMFDFSKSVLLESSSCNGLFPGQLDENKESALFSEELESEDYWNTTFELPYILWTYRMQPKIASRTLPRQRLTKSRPTSNAEYQEGFTDDNNIPFDNIVDARNIVEYTDEWMYNEPKFFGLEYGDLKSSVEKFRANKKDIHVKVMLKIIRNQAQHPDGKVKGYLIDVPKSKSLREKDEYTTPKISGTQISKNSEMYGLLAKKRLPEEAKKRLVHFYGPNRETALICYLASSEQDEISIFFQRHALYDKYFFDETTPILNTWETELHLSFYRITDENSTPKAPGISPQDKIEFPHSYQQSESKWIGRAVMSFRFDGDVFDRYWTCHFFECGSQRAENEGDFESLGIPNLKTAKNSSKEHPWKQRQVLELLLFDEILREMLKSTQHILKSAKGEVLRNPKKNPSSNAQTISLTSPLSDPLDLFQEVNGAVFDSTTQLWRKLHHILQVVEDDLSENLTIIGHWKDRQASRAPNRPRWTLKDERGYRSDIYKLLASNEQKIIKLKRCYADIESFKTLLSKRLEITRQDLDLRRANDLRLFTYVTVVFLPISFATGVFSMSDAPTAGIMGSMATTATVALLVTVVLLFNAKSLEAYLAQPLLSLFRRVFYNPIISPCVYFLARYLFFPLHSSLPDNILPPGKVKGFLTRLSQIGAISEARRDFFATAESRLEEGNPHADPARSSQLSSSQSSTIAQSEEGVLAKTSSERSGSDPSSMTTTLQ